MSALPLALAACAAPGKPLPHRRALERLALLESLDEHQANELALGVELACELLLVDDAAPAFARHRAAAELARWGGKLVSPERREARALAGASAVDRERSALFERARRDSDARRATLARGEVLREEDERRLQGELAALGALRGGTLATQLRALALCGALLGEAPPPALRAELDAACRALATEVVPAVVLTALRRPDPNPAVRAALAEAWLAVSGAEGFAALFACCREDGSEELRCLLIAEATRRTRGELESCGALAWLHSRAEDERSASSRFASRALRSLGLEAADR
ncbi:MAG: hypothetical protein IPN34_19990 [Planctomycetes bacterium]|nr:hypothetical protein [Planctomycetota bacterium]